MTLEISPDIDGPVPDYVHNAYQTFREIRVPGTTKLKNLSTGALTETAGRYYLPVGRLIMANQDEWSHVPQNSIDTEEFAHDVYHTIDDILPFRVSFLDEPDFYEIMVYVPIREGDDYQRLGETILSVLTADSRDHFIDNIRDNGHTHLRYLAADAVLPPHLLGE